MIKKEARAVAYLLRRITMLETALRQIAEAEELDTESFVCDFYTLQGIAYHTLKEPEEV